MATVTLYLSLSTRKQSGNKDVKQGDSGNNDLTITVNTTTVTSKGDFLELCKQASLMLPHTVV